MTQNPARAPRSDRLTAFFRTFDLSVSLVAPGSDAASNLIIAADGDGQPKAIHFFAHGHTQETLPEPTLVAAAVRFDGTMNPLINALPAQVVVALDEVPTLEAVTGAFVTEATGSHCGRHVVLERLCEVLVLLVLRKAIARGTTGPGLLAGLSHPALHHAIVAIHDQPDRLWRIEDLAACCGLSRSRFMSLFPKVVGTTPAAYLTAWRLTLGRRELSRGGRVKAVARQVGFGSAAAFTRAYVRAFGHAPTATRDVATLME